MFVAEGVEECLQRSVVVVLVVCDVVEPRGRDCVECEGSCGVDVIFLHDESGLVCDGLHVCVPMRVVAAVYGARFANEVGQEVPSGLNSIVGRVCRVTKARRAIQSFGVVCECCRSEIFHSVFRVL